MFLLGDKLEALKEYERYFGPKLAKKTGALITRAPELPQNYAL